MNILTFDIEEWFHLLEFEPVRRMDSWSSFESRIDKNLNRILELLDEANQPATFFVLGWIAEHYPNLIKRIDEQGYEIGLHSYGHQLLREIERTAFVKDLRKAKDIIQNITTKPLEAYRAPGFSLDQNQSWVVEELIEHQIKIDASICPPTHFHGGFKYHVPNQPFKLNVNGKEIKEFPVGYRNLMGIRFLFVGGGFFRFYPLSLIRSQLKKEKYNMTYFHPGDFDDKQPRLEGLPPMRRLQSYVGLKNNFQKFKKILKDTDFVDLRMADTMVDWDKVVTLGL